eukprot:8181402-Pyramimonas_sp.AAC.1
MRLEGFKEGGELIEGGRARAGEERRGMHGGDIQVPRDSMIASVCTPRELKSASQVFEGVPQSLHGDRGRNEAARQPRADHAVRGGGARER